MYLKMFYLYYNRLIIYNSITGFEQIIKALHIHDSIVREIFERKLNDKL